MALPHVPETAVELEAAVSDGVLVEGLSFDAKAELEPGPKGNTRLAIDLAAFAVNGGLIAVGVAEEKAGNGKRLIPRPIAVAGLRERVSQVGLSRVDPPIATVTRTVETEPGVGYLLILVPPSPDAPHMVDGRYRGRNDTTNYVIGDGDVRRIQSQRRREQPDIAAELERAVARDPSPPALRNHAHLFVAARPSVVANATMLQARLGREWGRWILENLVQQPQWGRFSPDLPNNATTLHRRPDGWAAASSYIGAARTVTDEALEDYLLELEVDEDGAVRLFCGRASDSTANSPVRWTFEVLIAGLTWRVVRAAGVIAAHTSYFGNWDFGVALTNARGIASHALSQRQWGEARLPFADDAYRALTQATYPEVTGFRDGVVERLVGRLNRALNDEVFPLPTFDHPAQE